MCSSGRCASEGAVCGLHYQADHVPDAMGDWAVVEQIDLCLILLIIFVAVLVWVAMLMLVVKVPDIIKRKRRRDAIAERRKAARARIRAAERNNPVDDWWRDGDGNDCSPRW